MRPSAPQKAFWSICGFRKMKSTVKKQAIRILFSIKCSAIHLLSIVNSSQPPTSRVISAHPIQFEKELDFRFSHKPTQAINLFNFLFICHTFRPQNTSQEKGAEKISMDRTEKKTPGCWSIPTLSFEGRQKPTKLTMAR